jgi:HSP20 family protein
MNNLIHYRPADLFDWNGVLDRFFDDTPVFQAGAPAVDVQETEKDYRMEMEVPGLTEKDITVEVKENLLTVSSRKEEQKEERKNGYLLRERRTGSFHRSFLLPEDVDRAGIGAQFRGGLLIVTLPKQEQAQPKRIEVRVEKSA